MNKKELTLTVIVLIGLLLTGFKFINNSNYDCVQPLFSNQSSCSMFNGSCINTQAHAGVGGLWDSFKSVIIEEDDGGYILTCMPGCSIRIDGNKEHTHTIDSASYSGTNAAQ